MQMQARLLASSTPTSPVSTPLKEHPNALDLSAPPYMSPPTVTGPLPPSANPATHQTPHERNPAVAFTQQSRSPNPPVDKTKQVSSGNRLRAGSASGGEKTKEVLNDIASQGKKGFNAIMQKLGGERNEYGDGLSDGEGSAKRAVGTSAKARDANIGAMKGVRVKREAEEAGAWLERAREMLIPADKAYRNGGLSPRISQVEKRKARVVCYAGQLAISVSTKRLSMQNLENFNDDLNVQLRAAMEKYIDIVHGTAATSAQSTEVVRQAVEAVNLDRDSEPYMIRRRRPLTDQPPCSATA